MSARASWSGERCLLLRVPCCGSRLFQLTTTSQNVGAELPPSSLLPSSPAIIMTQQWHQGSMRAQGMSCSPGHPEQGASLLSELPATHPLALWEPARSCHSKSSKMCHFRAVCPSHCWCPYRVPCAGGAGQPAMALSLAGAAPLPPSLLYLCPHGLQKPPGMGQGTAPASAAQALG